MLLFSFPKIINQNHYNMFEGKKKCLFVRKYQIFNWIVLHAGYTLDLFQKYILFANKILTVCKIYQIFNWVVLYAGYTLESPIYSNYRTATLSGFYVPGFNIIKGPKYCQCHKQLMKQLY